MQILVTGGLGFIGSNLVRHLLSKYPDYHIINLDAITYAGHPENLQDLRFGGADLRGANFNEAFLGGAYIDDTTDIRGATFENADLRHCQMTDKQRAYAKEHGAIVDFDDKRSDILDRRGRGESVDFDEAVK